MRFKQGPDFSLFHPGDVILVSATKDTVGNVITGVQNSILSSAPPNGDPRWSRDLKLRRLARRGAEITSKEGESVVHAATEYFEKKYSYWAIVKHLFSQTSLASPEYFFCSSFVALAYRDGLKFALERRVSDTPLMPATLALHSDFVDIPLEWHPYI